MPQIPASRLRRKDCICPICMEVLLKPVTLPCKHSFCLPCFEQASSLVGLTCPVCRKRFACWARHATLRGSLVDKPLWRAVQSLLPTRCRQRIREHESINGRGGAYDGGARPRAHGSDSSDGFDRLEIERMAFEAEEFQQSEQLIRVLQEEEQKEKQARDMERKRIMDQDEQLAIKISKEMVSMQGPTTSSNTQIRPDIQPGRKQKAKGKVKQLHQGGGDVIYSTEGTKVKTDDNDKVEDECQDDEMQVQNQRAGFDGGAFTWVGNRRKRVLGPNDVKQQEHKPQNSKCVVPFPSVAASSSRPKTTRVELPENTCNKMARIEESDRLFALRLQHMINRKIVDRRQGSENGYILRSRGGDNAEAFKRVLTKLK
uniref:RING-type E3 ubiquitin transferase n=1 Tax=Eptatretus burgeri TaxID=7764 RepID=A0A8C4R6C9_EPTBU